MTDDTKPLELTPEQQEIADKLRLVMIFKTVEELDRWVANRVNIESLRAKYPSKRHSCFVDRESKMLIVVRRSRALVFEVR